ncbi:hypothetical protein KAU33_01690 [Candidatus Dependentiae bacterium]|nr:hypothetical protein [Candidatus Dependentiae bacterium]
MENQITKQDLLQGDILLYRGSGPIAKVIRYFDGTSYSHTSLYMGKNEVMEAIAQGVVERDIDTSIKKATPVIIKRLNKRPQNMTPVLKKASEYKGDKYAYDQLLLLVLICTLRKIRLNNFVSKFLQKLFENVASILLKIKNEGKEALICSELVYRSYNEALPGGGDPYTIYLEREMALFGLPAGFRGLKRTPSISNESLIMQFYGVDGKSYNSNLTTSPFIEKDNIIKVEPSPSLMSAETEKELEDLFEDVVKSYQEEDYKISKEEKQMLKKSLDNFITSFYTVKNITKSFELPYNLNKVLESFKSVNADFVTPGDLFKAINLQYIGDLK